MTAHNLVELAEVLSGKTCAAKDRVKKRPETETARLQSTRLALDFISQVGVTPEKIPSADDLVLYDRDAVLGLLWSLMSEFERFGDAQMDTPMLVSMKRWVLQKLSYYPELTIRNFTNGWKDGKVLCVLIHSIAGKRMDFRVLNDTDPFANISRAFRDAKKMLMVDLKLKAKEFQDLDERGMVLLLSEPDSASSLESALSSRSTGDIGAWSPFAAVSRSARRQVSAPQFASAHAVLSGAHDGIQLATADTVTSVELHGGRGRQLPLNAYAVDFFSHGRYAQLMKENGLKEGYAWYLLQDWKHMLGSMKTALEVLLEEDNKVYLVFSTLSREFSRLFKDIGSQHALAGAEE
eukprot:212156_1